MAESSPCSQEARAALAFAHEEVFNLLIELSDLMESEAIPKQDGVSALRMAAGFCRICLIGEATCIVTPSRE
jgi:hypothetical protein